MIGTHPVDHLWKGMAYMKKGRGVAWHGVYKKGYDISDIKYPMHFK